MKANETVSQARSQEGQLSVFPGLVSITFRHLCPREIVKLVLDAGLSGIEWGGDIHVPAGDLGVARDVGRMTSDSGLFSAAYGSYYVVGKSENDGLSFQRVLNTSIALGSPLIRIWAGDRGSDETDGVVYNTILADARRISSMADSEGVEIAFEYHAGTLADNPYSTERLLNDIDRPNIGTMWQPPVDADDRECLNSLSRLLPHMKNMHVFHWGDEGFSDRRPLSNGYERWKSLIAMLSRTGRQHYALLEYVEFDSISSFLRDASILRELLHDSTAVEVQCP